MKHTHWTDESGRRWRVPAKGKRIQYSNAGPRALRAFVYRRDDFRCVSCGWRPEFIPVGYDGQFTVIGADVGGKRRELQVDHIVPLSLGGTNHPDNLQTLCFGCNAGKRDR